MGVGDWPSDVWRKEEKMPTDKEKDRLIVEAFGECFHEWEFKRTPGGVREILCTKCGYDSHGIPNIRLDTPEGFFWWFPWMQKMQCWVDFQMYCLHQVGPGYDFRQFPVRFIDPTRGRDVVYEFFLDHPEWRKK